MSKFMTILLAGFVVLTIVDVSSTMPALSWPAEEVVAAPSRGSTEVISFHPAIPKGPARDGYCWTPSIALQRADAWRCMIGNGIEDPCFATPDASDAVICGANPATSAAGFLLRLTQPLPATGAGAPTKPAPWIVELAIGQNQVPGPYAMPPPRTYCSPLTGTMPVVDGQGIPYSCWEANVESQPKMGDTQIGLLGDFKAGKVWTVTEVTFIVDAKPAPNQPPFKLTGRKLLAPEKGWQ